MSSTAPAAGGVQALRTRDLAEAAIPAALIGIGSSLVLLAISGVADGLEHLLWDTIPDGLSIGSSSAVWVIGVLTVTGLAVGISIWLVPGHAGPDPATQGLLSPPLPLATLPGLMLVTIIALGGGVSLGPENPITAANIALTVAVGSHILKRIPAMQLGALGAAGTVGALFATPVGAALVFSEVSAAPDAPPLFDRLFAPLVAAAAGATTTKVLSGPSLAVQVAAYTESRPEDALRAMVVGGAAALVMLVDTFAFRHSHALFQRLRHPVAMLTAGGALLGVLGAIGGTITLFKGLDQMKQLAVDDLGTGRLTVIVVVKLVALLVASTCGFRGGRIFPAVFIGVAVGLLANSLASGVPAAVAVSAGVLGTVIVVTRDGWLSLFMAAVIVPDADLIPILVVAVLPLWLLVRQAPEMLIPPAAPHPGGTTAQGAAPT